MNLSEHNNKFGRKIVWQRKSFHSSISLKIFHSIFSFKPNHIITANQCPICLSRHNCGLFIPDEIGWIPAKTGTLLKRYVFFQTVLLRSIKTKRIFWIYVCSKDISIWMLSGISLRLVMVKVHVTRLVVHSKGMPEKETCKMPWIPLTVHKNYMIGARQLKNRRPSTFSAVKRITMKLRN